MMTVAETVLTMKDRQLVCEDISSHGGSITPVTSVTNFSYQRGKIDADC